MTRTVIFLSHAEQDIRSAYQWYESQQTGLGEEFLTSLRQKFESLQTFPESAAVIYKNIRRVVVPRFPYLVFYLVDQTSVVVIGVLHTSRNPAIWPKG